MKFNQACYYAMVLASYTSAAPASGGDVPTDSAAIQDNRQKTDFLDCVTNIETETVKFWFDKYRVSIICSYIKPNMDLLVRGVLVAQADFDTRTQWLDETMVNKPVYSGWDTLAIKPDTSFVEWSTQH